MTRDAHRPHPRPAPDARPARLRVELFVRDLDASVSWYARALAFAVERVDDGYASLRRGNVLLGLGPVAKLPLGAPDSGETGHTQESLAHGRGAGVELVLELPSVSDVEVADARVSRIGWPLAAPLADRPWGLRDFRVLDPDGYYWRVTHAGG